MTEHLPPPTHRMNVEGARTTLAMLKSALPRADRAAVNRACAALVEGQAPLAGQWKAIATVLQHNGEHGLAIRAAAAWAEQHPDEEQPRAEQAAVLAHAGRLAEAWAVLQTLPDDGPPMAERAYLKGTVLTNLGRFEEACDHLRRAVDGAPRSGEAWLALAMTGRSDGSDLKRLQAVARLIAAAPAHERAAYLYAKARMIEPTGTPEKVFSAISQGAGLAAATRPYDHAADTRSATIACDGWDTTAIRHIQTLIIPDDKPPPIFVTGLPRSGTTLVEQILAVHSQIGDGGEIGLFRLLHQDIGGASKKVFDRFLARGGAPVALRDLYFHLAAQRFPGPGRIIDKTLDASRNMGLITALFPDAPIVWLRRDPLDCAWSAYRTWFARGLAWSWRLEDIAAHFRIEDQLFAHWREQLGHRLLVLDYQDLAENSEPAIARLLDHCGLPHEPACFAPHRYQRTVTTASVAQVREPINRKGLGSAAPYRQFLQPFTAAYDS